MTGSDWIGLDPRSVLAGRLSAAIATAILALLQLLITLVLLLSGLPWPATVSLVILGWLWVGGRAVAAVILPERRYRFTRLRVVPEGLDIERGKIFQTKLAVPRVRIQHTDVSQGPIERAFGVATLTVYTAGTYHNAVSVRGLAQPTAAWLRTQLAGFSDDAAV